MQSVRTHIYDSFNIESPERKDEKERVMGRICVKNNTQRVVTTALDI